MISSASQKQMPAMSTIAPRRTYHKSFDPALEYWASTGGTGIFSSVAVVEVTELLVVGLGEMSVISTGVRTGTGADKVCGSCFTGFKSRVSSPLKVRLKASQSGVNRRLPVSVRVNVPK